MASTRNRAVPLGVTVLAVFLGLFALTIGTRVVIDPSTAIGYAPGADALGLTWGGRNAGLGIALLVAVLVRRPSAYVVAFAAQLPREISDLLNTLPSVVGVLSVAVFVAIDLVGLGFSLRALRREGVRGSVPGSSRGQAHDTARSS